MVTDQTPGNTRNARSLDAQRTTNVTAPVEKVTFASSEWLDLAREALEDLVAQHSKPGASFSVCEVFTNAPEGLIGPDPTKAAWYFSIKDNAVTVGEGEIEGADMAVSVDYAKALPAARRVYPAFLGWLVMPVVRLVSRLRGKPSPPSYLLDLHNRLALVTELPEE